MFVKGVARPEAFDALFDRMWPTTVGLARRLVGSSDAEDVAVEAFARALERWSSVRRHANVDAWLLRVVTNVAVDHVRRENRVSSRDENRAPVVAAEEPILRAALVEALRRLPRRQREVIVLRYLADYTEPAVSSALGISLGSVKTHARRGMATLRARLGDDREALLDGN
jgi:RNA polymerase sigma-70 factor (ECF subfamily)